MRYACLVVVMLFCCALHAQLNGKYTFRHIDQTDGLLHSTVRSISQDKRGFIWILSLGGLQRYDGTRFTNYTEVLDPSTGKLVSADLYMDTSNNYAWIIKGPVVERLDITNNRFQSFTIKEVLENDTLHPPVLFDHEGLHPFLMGPRGKIFYDPESKTEVASFFHVNPEMKPEATEIYFDSTSGNYFTHNYEHMIIADPVSKKVFSTSDQSPAHPLLQHLKKRNKSQRIRFLMFDSYDNIWIVRWDHEYYRYNLLSGEFQHYSLQEIIRKQDPKNKADLTLLTNKIFEDRQKNLWFATDYAGLLLYNREKDDFEYISSQEKIRNGLRYNYSVFSIFQDKNDNIWLGTDRGINIFNPYRNYFSAIRHIEETRNTLPKQDINGVFETGFGELLVATWGGGISVFDHQWNFIRNIEFTENHTANLTWCFIESNDCKIWIGTQGGYIHIYDPVVKTIETIRPPEVKNQTIITMVKDQDGNILIGLNDGRIAVWNENDNRFYAYNDRADDNHGGFSRIWSLFVDDKNRCWVATDYSLKEFDPDNRKFINYYYPGESRRDILVQGIEQYNDSLLIVGTMYDGIYLFNLKSRGFSRPFKENQHPYSAAYAFKKDDNGNVWFTTNYTIVRCAPDFKAFTIFDLGKSITTAPFTSCHFYELSDGRWVTNSWAELICFDPRDVISHRNLYPDVELSSFKVINDVLHLDSILANGHAILLPHDKNFFSIEFTSLDYLQTQETNYYYRLVGIDKNWKYSTDRTFADYTDIKPGQYKFEVKTDGGGDTSAISSIDIIIKPPWWGTNWFRILVIVFVASAFYLILKRRIRTIRKESELKQRIAETEMMALRSQMNPHFIFNCINGIDAMIQSNDKYKATVYLNKFAKLIRNILEISKHKKVPFSKDIETLQLYIDLELFRHPGKFSAVINADEELIQNDYTVPPLIIQPYVENAIIHGLRHRSGQEGTLNINVSKNDHHILYSIEDNGIGRKKMNGAGSPNHNGYGMQIGNDRIRLFNKEEIASIQITDLENDGVPSGTRVEVQLRIQ